MSDFYQSPGIYPYINNVPELLELRSPMPYWFFQANQGDYPYMRAQEVIITGAFCYAAKLSSVTIPESVKSIGKYSFTHTALTSVVLPDNCTYYATSFPEGCTVTGGVLIA